MAKNKELLILERASVKLKPTTDDKNVYIMEGEFGAIGVRNKNNRIYDEDQYIPQIQALQEKIKSGTLLGELDHPKNFEISLKNVSHVVESLEYDKASKTIKGRIRLLNTKYGKDAQALVDDGIPLHISSRAAGSVNENGHVIMKKLFTYDLVADPGFANAQLNRVNEAYGFENTDNLYIYEIDSEEMLKEEEIAEPVEVPKEEKEKDTEIKNTDSKMEEHVTVAEFDGYSRKVIAEFAKVTKQVEDLKLENSNSESDAKIDQLIEHVNEMGQKFNNLSKYVGYLATELDESIGYKEHIANNSNKLEESHKELKAYVTGHIAPTLDNSIKFTNKVAEGANALIKEHNELVDNFEALDETVTNNTRYIKYVAETVDHGLAYSEKIAESFNLLLSESNTLEESLKSLEGYSKYLGENVNTVINAVNENDSTLDNVVKYVEVLQEGHNNLVKANNELDENVKNIDVKEEKVEENKENDLNAKINMLIESAKKQKAEVNESSTHFLRFLDEGRKADYLNLDESVKAKIKDALKEKAYTSSKEVVNVYESIVNPAPEVLDFIENMDESYKELWSSLSEARQAGIKAQAAYYPLDTQEQINHFWSTRDLRPTQVKIEQIQENANDETPEGLVSKQVLDNYAEQIKKRFNK